MYNWNDNWNEYIFGSTLGGCDDVYEWLVKSSCNRTSKNLPKTPTIRFTDVDCLPTVSTCDVSLMFPRKMALLQFQTKMNFCIKGSYGFGTIWAVQCRSSLLFFIFIHIYLTFITTEPLVGLELFEQSIIIFITFITLRFTEPLVLFEYHIIILAISIIMFIINMVIIKQQ